MSELRIISGNIFTSKCQTIVNTVNCVGVMGAGIALECRLRYPAMYEQYAALCKDGKIDIGTLWIYKATERWILNFPTKQHWKYPTKEEYLHAGLRKFMGTYEARGVESIAFPVLGAQNGGLEAARSIEIMESYLRDCHIRVEIYQYDPMAMDDLFDKFKDRMLNLGLEDLKNVTGLRSDYINRIRDALVNPNMRQLNQLAKVNGIGDKTLEKAFAFLRNEVGGTPGLQQRGLDL
jgi:O-acetyl-ADP-ribose deacetylase (regulator of RNase III)